MPLIHFWYLWRRHKKSGATWSTCWDWQNYYSGRWFTPWRAIIWFLFRRRRRCYGPLRIRYSLLLLAHLYVFDYLCNSSMHASSSDVQLRWLESIWRREASQYDHVMDYRKPWIIYAKMHNCQNVWIKLTCRLQNRKNYRVYSPWCPCFPFWGWQQRSLLLWNCKWQYRK